MNTIFLIYIDKYIYFIL